MAEDWTVHEVSGKWADAAGRSIAIDFQALQYRDGMVTWAYADVLRNMYSGRKTCQAWAEAQKEREPLTAFAELCGVSYGEHFVPSRRQVRAGWAMSAYTRDSQQLSTLLLLCQLLCWSCSSWKHVMKEKARTMLTLLLSGTVQLSLISCQMVEHMWSDAVSFCDSSMGQTACGHFDGASFSMGEASVGMTPVERLVAHLVLVAPIAGACRACKHVLSVCVRGLAEAINGSLATMCPAKPPHKARSRTGGSKQGSRVTDTFRRFASRSARGKRMGRQGKSAARQEGFAASTFHRWVRKDMCAYWMACRRLLQPRGTIAIYEDASRLGNPAQECLVMLGYCCDSDKGCVLPTQVLKDWRGVRSKLGKWCAEGQEAWRRRLRHFLCVQKAKTKGQPGSLQAKRLANWHSVLALDHALEGTFGVALKHFLPGRALTPLAAGKRRDFVSVDRLPEALRASCYDRSHRAIICDEDGGRAELEALWSGKRACLQTTLDMGSIGWPGRAWLFLSSGVRGARWIDAAHRRHNNAEDSVQTSGLAAIRAEGLIVCNTNAGPWGEAANYQKWREAAQEWLASTTRDDELFQMLYPFFTHDLHGGVVPASYGSEAHMDYIRDEIGRIVQAGKGSIVRLNRWFNLWQRARGFVKVWSVHLLPGLLQCIQRGFIGHVSECQLFAHREPLVVDGPGALVAAGATSAGEVVAAGTETRGVKSKHGELAGLRGRCANGVHLATVLLSSRSSRALMIGLTRIIQPVEIRHNKDMSRLKTQDGRLAYNVGLACERDLQYIPQAWSACFGDMSALADMAVVLAGIEPWLPTLCDERATAILQSLLEFWRQWASLEIQYVSLHSKHMPGMCFTQLHPEEEERSRGLALMKTAFETLERAEAAALENPAIGALLRDLEWPSSTWSREILLGAAECRFERVPADIRQQLHDAARCIGCSKIIEDAFNMCRSETEGVRNKRQSPMSVWGTIAESDLAAEYDLRPVQSSNADEVESGTALPSTIFSAAKHEAEFSLGARASESFFRDLGYATLSAQRHLSLGLASQMMMSAPTPAHMLKAWQALLAVEGTLLWNVLDSERVFYVLQATEHGILAWRGSLMGSGDYRHFQLETDAPCWEFVPVWDASEWECMDVRPRLPHQVQASSSVDVVAAGICSVTLELLPNTSSDLVRFSAMRGFPRMNLTHLNKFWDLAEVRTAGRRPTLMLDVLRELVRVALGGSLSEDSWEEILRVREAITHKTPWRSAIEGNEHIASEITAKDHEQLERDVGGSKKKGSASGPASSGAVVAVDGGAARGNAGPCVALSPVPLPAPTQPREKKSAAFSKKHYTQEEAAAMLPRVKGSTISPVGHRQWQVKYGLRDHAPRSHTQTYDEKEGVLLHCRALARCLKWAWDVHRNEKGGGPCPFDIDAVAAALEAEAEAKNVRTLYALSQPDCACRSG